MSKTPAIAKDHKDGEYAHRTFDKYASMDVLKENPGEVCVMSGNEAVARGALEAGVALATSYPGSPTTYILDSLSYAAQKYGFHAEWSVNEKVGFEVALGAAMVGKYAMHITKNVGMSWIMDPLINQRGWDFHGALVLAIGDDPEANTTSVEMDCRQLAMAAEILVLTPSTHQEIKDYAVEAFKMSERLGHPVMLELTRVLCYGRGLVTIGEIDHETRNRPASNDHDPIHWTCNVSPEYLGENLAYNRHKKFHGPGGQWEKIQKEADNFAGSELRLNGTQYGMISSGVPALASEHAIEDLGVADEVSFLKLGTAYPLPQKKVEQLLAHVDEVLIAEEVEPVIEMLVRDLAADMDKHAKVFGKRSGHIKICGSVDNHEVTQGLAKMMGRTDYVPKFSPNRRERFEKLREEMVHRPQGYFCPGCPELAGIYAAKRVARKLYKKKWFSHGDIGCYEHAHSEPWNFMQSVLCMGAGPSLGGGNYFGGLGEKIIANLGDSTFFHAAMPAMVNNVYNQNDITYLIHDNRCTASTGHQPHPGAFGMTAKDEPTKLLSIEEICKAFQVDYVGVANPYNLKESMKVIEEGYKTPGVSVVVLRATCAVLAERQMGGKAKAQLPLYEINPDECLYTKKGKCLACVKELGCPAIMRQGDDLRIDAVNCFGCSMCSQMCPPGAIHEVERSYKNE
jgi:indolepyruvate ferredoxin oxidoreductase alpha subunit